MGREVRRVPANWKHPKNAHGQFIPLFDGHDYAEWAKEWDEGAAKWARREFPKYASENDRKMTYTAWAGFRPNKKAFMPDWPETERTHYMMYETTTEGTPISPAFATQEALAQWLADTGASAFGDSTASYDAWLRVAKGVYAPSAVYTPEHGLQSGVDGVASQANTQKGITP